MKNRDDRLLEEAYEEVQEGFLQRSDAKGGTRLKSLGSKAMGGLGKAASAMGATTAGANLQQGAGQMKGQVDAKRLGQLVQMYTSQVQKIIDSINTDVQKLGIDVKNPEVLAANPEAGKLAKGVGSLKAAITILTQRVAAGTTPVAQTGKLATGATAPPAATAAAPHLAAAPAALQGPSV